MSTRSEPGQPPDSRILEPIRVLRPRRTDALAELIEELRRDAGGESGRKTGGEPSRDAGGYESVAVPSRPRRDTRPPAGAEDETQEIPPVTTDGGGGAGPRSGRGLRLAALAVAVTAAALAGFGSALLLPDRSEDKDDSAAPAAPPPATATASPAPAPTAPTDPDGPGTLREGAAGPDVTELQQRLLRIPDVYTGGSTNGRYDADLTEAVARFQLWYGIRGDETGVYGDDTRLALESRTG
ncbi:peptidoglycan-binding domain-containing protein [Streptomyces sp. S.PNR 29]|uniref:peptidoglycan-binding domain-containing protein n=1 Tax=Streptomyces sp. S.PNR 29 TaxID=2973805 RepID=UPI0025AF74D7|nr:peptidoglycan-binding domain-containing protein [Streptomyces sp. S.PNR 29]MDN0197820.1 peptidoglycan-binding protein [Streptomyces sp. S.PNR 29]